MLQIVLTFVPVLTILATILVAAATRGLARWIALFALPLAGTALSWWGLPVAGENGNMLAVVLLLLLTIGLVVYYPVLVIALFARKSKRLG